MRKIDIFELGVHRREAFAGRGFRIDTQLVLAADEMRRNDLHRFFQSFVLGIGGHDFCPDAASEGFERLRRHTFNEQLSVADHGHARAELPNVVNDVRGEDHHNAAADGAEQIEETIAFGGVEAGGGFIHDDKFGTREERLGDAETLLHAAGISSEGLFAKIPEVGLLQEAFDELLAFAAIRNALHDREMI